MKRKLLLAILASATMFSQANAQSQEQSQAQSEAQLLQTNVSNQNQGQTVAGAVTIDIKSGQPEGLIDPKLYGQLFEHIYFSANNGIWQELIYERSFEPEQFPGITPRDGYFDGWYVDDEQVLHSPTRHEQPIDICSTGTDKYEISTDINWRAYQLANHSWGGGLLDIRIAFRNKADGEPYFFRIHNPKYEGTRRMMPGASAQPQAPQDPTFSIDVRQEVEMPFFGGRTRKMKTLVPLTSAKAPAGVLEDGGDWHSLRISCDGKKVKVYWDSKCVLTYNSLETTGNSDIAFWENSTQTFYRNIKVAAKGSKQPIFEGIPEDVKLPAVAQQWNSFGEGEFSLVKDDAVNMRYSQKISASHGAAGVFQGPQNIIKGEQYIGSIYAKGDGRGKLSVALKRSSGNIALKVLGTPSSEWTKYEFTLDAGEFHGDADFAICVEGGTVQVDQVSMTTASAKAIGGFRPDLFQAVKKLNPTCLRWPGGGYVAQYRWKWGIGPQEQRERWPHWMWMDYDQNAFGTDEFIRFCREINTEPIIVVSVGYDRPEADSTEIFQEAMDWLAYCNEPATGKWGSVRAANGHPEPYNVKYWEIDNEMWEMGIEKYEAKVRKFSKAMREIDPSIKIIVCGGFREDQDFINRSANYFDYMSLHHYEQPGGYATGPEKLHEMYLRYADMIAASSNPNIKLFISEWNLSSIDWRTGLFAGGFLNMCEKTPVVELGAAALFLRRTDAPDWNNAFINFDYKDYFVAPNYLVSTLWRENFSKYRLAFTGETGNLNVVTTLSEDGSSIIVKIVNPTETASTITIRGDWEGISEGTYKYYAPGSLTAENSMTDKNAVALHELHMSPTDNTVTIDIDPLSAGVLVLRKNSR